ncbi:MAG: aldehyde dehydrogenase family protein [Methanomassiliicoccales archaeon]|nr:MAG: aldehyde dehydrogenase family protein [Methanomassiliicoccales archaeon]
MFVRSIDPRNGKLVAETPCTRPEDVQTVLAKAKKAQKAWASMERSHRIEVLRRAEEIFQRDKEEIIDLIQREGGFPRRDIAGAYAGALRGVEYYAEQYSKRGVRKLELDQNSLPSTEAEVEFVPHGVIGHIGIWNYPFWQTMITAIPALMVGNAIVFKPSEHTTLTGLRIEKALKEAGIPDNVFNVVVGGKEIGEEMVRSDFDAIVFTGGIETGLSIIRNAGIKPLILELSGNDPGIVCDDADIVQAARGIANGTFSHGGQVCIRIKRVYVTRTVADEFLEEFLKVVDRIDVKERVGPLIREEARTSVHASVISLIEKGAKLLRGGRYIEGEGYYYEPTVLLVDRSIDIDKEIFGPVCPIIIVDNEEEAIELANRSRYGLGATVWSSDRTKARAMASKLEAGTVWINECGRTLTGGEYFQGWKCSGIATSQDRLSMFMKKRTIIHNTSCEPRGHWMK